MYNEYYVKNLIHELQDGYRGVRPSVFHTRVRYIFIFTIHYSSRRITNIVVRVKLRLENCQFFCQHEGIFFQLGTRDSRITLVLPTNNLGTQA